MIEEVIAKLGEDVKRVDETKITFHGILMPETKSDYERLAYLCYKFRETVKYATAKLHKGAEITYKDLMSILPSAKYCEDVIRFAKASSKARRRPEVKKLFLRSTGDKNRSGNRNVRINLKNNTVRVRDPFSLSWLLFRLKVDDRIHQYTFDHYTVTISFRDGKIRIFVTIPYKPPKYLEGKYIAAFDLNSDRVNMVIVDKRGVIRDIRNIHFHSVVSHGFPRNRAKDIRLKSLAKLLDYAKHNNCHTVVFENLKMKSKTKTKTWSRKVNRKITKFACKQLLDHGINMALRRGFRVYLVSPRDVSKMAKEIHGKLGLDVHSTSAYLLALRFLKYKLSKR